jgi:hypothetical protein
MARRQAPTEFYLDVVNNDEVLVIQWGSDGFTVINVSGTDLDLSGTDVALSELTGNYHSAGTQEVLQVSRSTQKRVTIQTTIKARNAAFFVRRES